MRRAQIIGNEGGMVLVVVLLMLALLTAIVVEFAYGVYVNTGLLYNWRQGQNLSMAADSGATVAAELIRQALKNSKYTYPGTVDVPPMDPFDQGIFVGLRIEDEDSKFNLNSLVFQNGSLNEPKYEGLRRMLRQLDLDPSLADAVVDYIDKDSIARGTDTEQGARDEYMESVDELLLVAGVDKAVYNTLASYVTVFGSGSVNINGASVPVLMSLSDELTEDMALRVEEARDESPFEQAADLQRVAGFESLGITLIGSVSVKGTAFQVTSEASDKDGLKRRIVCVLDASGGVKYWKET